MGAAGDDLRGSEERDMLDRRNAPQRSDGEPQAREQRPEVLEREVEEIRDNISGIVGELDRRRQELVDWRLQLRKHGPLLAAVGASCIVGFGLTVAIGVARRKRRKQPLAKARRLREAIGRMIEHPELVARPQPPIGRKALSAVVSVLAGALAKALVRRILDATEPEPARLGSTSEWEPTLAASE